MLAPVSLDLVRCLFWHLQCATGEPQPQMLHLRVHDVDVAAAVPCLLQDRSKLQDRLTSQGEKLDNEDLDNRQPELESRMLRRD